MLNLLRRFRFVTMSDYDVSKYYWMDDETLTNKKAENVKHNGLFLRLKLKVVNFNSQIPNSYVLVQIILI